MERFTDIFISLGRPLLWVWLLSVAIFIWWIYVIVPDSMLFGLTKLLMKANIIVGMTAYILSVLSTVTCILAGRKKKK